MDNNFGFKRTYDELVDQYFPPEARPTAKRIIGAESSFDPKANPTNKNKSKDSGLFQINDVNIPTLQEAGIIKTPNDLFDPKTNVKAAAFLHSKYGFQPWNASKDRWDVGTGRKEEDFGFVPLPSEAIAPTPTKEGAGEKKPSTYQKWIRPATSGLVEAIGLVGGGVAGAAAGAPVGGVGAVVGAPVGAGLGYAGAKQLYRTVEDLLGVNESPIAPLKEQLIRSGKEVATGAGYEMGGQIAGKSIGLVGQGVKGGGRAIKEKLGFPSVTEKGIKKTVAERFGKVKAGAESQQQVLENIKVAKELQDTIPGLKFSYGQITNDADAIALERALARGGGASLSQQQRAVANKALEDYYTQRVVTGGQAGEATDYLGALGKQKETLETTVKATQQKVDTEVMRMSKHLDEQSIGGKIKVVLTKGQQVARDKANKLYDQIPNVEVETNTLNKTLDDVLADFDPVVENSSNIPLKLINGVKRMISKKGEVVTSKIVDASGKPITINVAEQAQPLGFKELRKLRSNILAEIRTAQGSATPNTQYIRRLKMIQEGVENTIDSLKDSPDMAGKLYREASSYYKEYASKFKQGTVADILQKGARGEETKIGMANIASRFNKLDAIDDFVKAVGDKKVATDSMRDFYQFDFLNKVRTPEGELNAKSAMKWLYNNAGKLKKLGLYDEFKNITVNRYSLQVAEKNLDVFNKSVANKILEADVNDFIRTAFRGSKNYGATAQELLNKVKGDKAATQGLKKAFAENLMREAETTNPEFFQATGAETAAEIEFSKSVAKLTNNLKKYESAIKVIFKDEPQKIKAINEVWKSYQILARTTKSPLGGGSDTMENVFNVLIGAGGARAGKFYLIKSIRDAFSKYSERHINEYMRQIMFNPEYAANFVSFKKGVTPYKLSNLNRLMTLITYKISEPKEEQQTTP